MPRPLERLGIVELEQLFSRPDTTPTQLRSLESELAHRSTARAQKLLAEVKKHLAQANPKAAGRTTKELPGTAQVEIPGIEEFELSAPVSEPKPTPVSTPKTIATELIKPTAPQVVSHDLNKDVFSVSQALKILGLTAAASWEQIEQARRDLVARGRPDKLQGLEQSQKDAIKAACIQANAAYKVLAESRVK